MQQTQKRLILIILVTIIILSVVFIYFKNNKPEIISTLPDNQELMSLDVYIQDKEAAETSDCRITQKVTYKVPKTSAVADASLKILFEKELTNYGVYKSVTISDGVARIMLESENTPNGKPIGSLSSCEIGHLQSVLIDTLTQYENIKMVDIYSSKGRVEF